MHPELFELKALVAGRLDTHRRREIDDHLGSCADCSRHYVALMLGSSSPKTAEAEARQVLVPTGTGSPLAFGAIPPVNAYGIDAPIAPYAPRVATRQPHSNGQPLETEFPASSARTQVPVSASLVDAIAKLRSESDGPRPAAPAPSMLIEPSIFQPTPVDGVSIVRPMATPTASELPGFMTRPASPSPARSVQSQPELVVTFSSTPSRLNSHRTPLGLGTLPGGASQYEYVSQAVPTATSQPLPEFSFTETTVGRRPKPMVLGGVLGAAALAIILAITGFKYFKSSVANAAAAAAAAAAQQVQAAAARAAAPAPVAAAPVTPAPSEPRVGNVQRSVRRGTVSRGATDAPAGAPASPASSPSPSSVVLPDVNLSTGASDALQANTQRNATSELTRSARPTSTRTAAPRPF